jgi:ornithine carbamoyltransferase
MLGCAKAGLHYVNCTPPELMPDPALVDTARRLAGETGGSVSVAHDPAAAVKGANVLYTDVWVSMGEEAQKEMRLRLLRSYQVNMALCRATGNLGGELIFLHCLPAFHDDQTQLTHGTGALEVADDVFESPFSRVFDESENRMHTMKALFVSAMAEDQ